MKLAQRLRTLRERRGWSLREAMNGTGCTYAMLWRYENGKSTPSATKLVKLAKRYGVSEAWLLGTKEPTRETGWTREFTLERDEDVSGVSGTGTVAVGVVLPTGRCIIEWLPGRVDVRSIVVYQSLDEVREIHGHGGATRIVFSENGASDMPDA